MVFTRKRAVLIGVDAYEHVPPLQFSGGDARDVGAAFRNSLQFDPNDILEFTAQSILKPQRSAILHHLGEFIKNGIGADELLIFFFSGHGMIDSQEGKDYLLPIDASANDLKETGLRVESIVKRLADTGCKNIVMFIDACRDVINDGAKSIVSIGNDTKTASQRAGVVTFFSCDPKERSYEIAALNHGSFTHCVLEAIATGEHDTVEAIDKYLRENVPLRNSQNNKPPQLPYSIIEPAEKGRLAIFYSEARSRKNERGYDAMFDLLGDLYADFDFNAQCFDQAIALLQKAKSGALTDHEQKMINCIKLLCDKTFTIRAFEVAWTACGRRQLNSAAPAKQLHRLQ
jgi:hypothetical protein